jgi:hypothetical protein
MAYPNTVYPWESEPYFTAINTDYTGFPAIGGWSQPTVHPFMMYTEDEMYGAGGIKAKCQDNTTNSYLIYEALKAETTSVGSSPGVEFLCILSLMWAVENNDFGLADYLNRTTAAGAFGVKAYSALSKQCKLSFEGTGWERDAGEVDRLFGLITMRCAMAFDMLYPFIEANDQHDGYMSLSNIQKKIWDAVELIRTVQIDHPEVYRGNTWATKYSQNHFNDPSVMGMGTGISAITATPDDRTRLVNTHGVSINSQDAQKDIIHDIALRAQRSMWTNSGCYWEGSNYLETFSNWYYAHHCNARAFGQDMLSGWGHARGLHIFQTYTARPSTIRVNEPLIPYGDVSSANSRKHSNMSSYRFAAKYWGDGEAQWLGDRLTQLSYTLPPRRGSADWENVLIWEILLHDYTVPAISPEASGWPTHYCEPDKDFIFARKRFEQDASGWNFAASGWHHLGRGQYIHANLTHPTWDSNGSDSEWSSQPFNSAVPPSNAQYPLDMRDSYHHVRMQVGMWSLYGGGYDEWRVMNHLTNNSSGTPDGWARSTWVSNTLTFNKDGDRVGQTGSNDLNANPAKPQLQMNKLGGSKADDRADFLGGRWLNGGINVFSASNNHMAARTELANLYPTRVHPELTVTPDLNLDEVNRHWMFLRNKGPVVVIDTIDAQETIAPEWNFLSQDTPDSSDFDSDRWVRSKKSDDSLVTAVKFVKPTDGAYELDPSYTNSGLGAYMDDDDTAYVWRVSKSMPGGGKMRFIAYVYPTTASGYGMRPDVAEIIDNDDISAIEATYLDNSSEVYILNHHGYDVGGSFFAAGYEINGFAGIIERAPGFVNPIRCSLTEGTRLKFGADTYIQTSVKTKIIEVEYSGTSIIVTGEDIQDATVMTHRLPSSYNSLTINGVPYDIQSVDSPTGTISWSDSPTTPVGTEHYIDSTVADDLGNGEQTTPWKTYNAHSGSVFTGDTVYLKRGATFAEQIKFLVNNVTIKDYGDPNAGKPIINAVGQNIGVHFNVKDDCTVENIEVTGASGGGENDGIWMDGARGLALNCDSHNNGRHGITVRTGDDNVVDGGKYYDNVVPGGSGLQIHIANNTIAKNLTIYNCADGINAFNSNNIEILDNHLTDFNIDDSSDGVQLKECANYKIHRCHISDAWNALIITPDSLNGSDGSIIFNTLGKPSDTTKYAINLRISTATVSQIRRNTFSGTYDPVAKPGSVCLRLEEGMAGETIAHQGNLYDLTKGICFSVGSGASAANINTDRNCYYTEGGLPSADLIFYDSLGPKTLFEQNEFADYQTAVAAEEANSIATYPNVVDLENEIYFLNTTSPCINTGYNGGQTPDFYGNPAFVGVREDIGASEAGSFAPVNNPLPSPLECLQGVKSAQASSVEAYGIVTSSMDTAIENLSAPNPPVAPVRPLPTILAPILIHHWGSDVSVQTKYSTDVTEAITLSEERRILRIHPYRSMTTHLRGLTTEDTASIVNIMARHTSERQPVPLLSDQAPLSADVNATLFTIPVVTKDFRFASTKRVFIHNFATGDFEIHQLTPNGVSPIQLTLETPLVKSYPMVSSFVFPAIDTEVDLNLPTNFLNDQVTDITVTFNEVQEASTLPGATVDSLPYGVENVYKGDPIFPLEPNWRSVQNFSFKRSGKTYTVGRSIVANVRGDTPQVHISIGAEEYDRASIFKVIHFFESRKGRAYPFWVAAPNSVFNLHPNIAPSGTVITNSGELEGDLDTYTQLFNHITVFQGAEGIQKFYEIDHFENSGGNTEIHTVETFDTAPGTATAITSGHYCRFVLDTLGEHWITDDKCSFNLSMVELKEEKDVEVQLPSPTVDRLNVSKMWAEVILQDPGAYLSFSTDNVRVTKLWAEVIWRE